MYTSGVSRVRFSGLTSGMDVDSIVEKTLQIEQLKIDRVFQNKTLTEWKREALNSVSDSISTFKNTYFSFSSPNNIITSSLFDNKIVNMEKNPYIEITAGANAENNSMTITKIKLAREAYASSSEILLPGGVKVYEMTLSELATAMGKTLNKNEDGKIEMTINGHTFSFEEGQSINNIVNTINAAEGIGVRMIFNEFNNKFEIKSLQTGADAVIDISGEDGLFFGEDGLFGFSTATVNGENAQIVIDGVAKTFQSNIFEIGGVKFKLLKDTEKEIDFSITTDIENGINRIKAFVEDYNKLILDLEKKLAEPVYRDFKPLTDAQKKEMKESEISAWEEKARSGLLARDNNIRKLLNDMRSAFIQPVGNIGITFAEIGIKTGTWENKGKIFIDENKLRAAIEQYGSKITKMFNQVSNNADSDIKYQESGLAYKIEACILNYSKITKDYTIKSFDNAIKDYQRRIDIMNEQLIRKENSLYEKYTAMERSMAQLINQSSWFFLQ